MENDSIKAEEEEEQVETVSKEDRRSISPALVLSIALFLLAAGFLGVVFVYRQSSSASADTNVSEHSDHQSQLQPIVNKVPALVQEPDAEPAVEPSAEPSVEATAEPAVEIDSVQVQEPASGTLITRASPFSIGTIVITVIAVAAIIAVGFYVYQWGMEQYLLHQEAEEEKLQLELQRQRELEENAKREQEELVRRESEEQRAKNAKDIKTIVLVAAFMLGLMFYLHNARIVTDSTARSKCEFIMACTLAVSVLGIQAGAYDGLFNSLMYISAFSTFVGGAALGALLYYPFSSHTSLPTPHPIITITGAAIFSGLTAFYA